MVLPGNQLGTSILWVLIILTIQCVGMYSTYNARGQRLLSQWEKKQCSQELAQLQNAVTVYRPL